MEKKHRSGGIAILIVEDDDAASNILALMVSLEFPDAAVDVASSGEEGLSFCRAHMPSIVVSDIQLSAMDGISMAEQIKSFNPAVKLIFMTGCCDKDAMARFSALGVSACIVKPIELSGLFHAIKNCIEQVRQEQR